MMNSKRLPRFARNDIHPLVIARSDSDVAISSKGKRGCQAEIATLRSQ
jgi:hypothetical protein